MHCILRVFAHRSRHRASQRPPTGMASFSSATTSTCFLLLHLVIIFFHLPTPAVSLAFNCSRFTTEDLKDMKFEGDASFNTLYGSIPMNTNTYRVASRVSYSAAPLQLWDKMTGEVASFTTQFQFQIHITGDESSKGGMAFFLAGYPSSLPGNCTPDSLGLTNQSADAVPSGDSRFVSVKFDNFNNTIVADPDTSSYDHIGINVNSLISVSTQPLPSFTLNNTQTAQIEYDNVSSILAVTLWSDDADGQDQRSSSLSSKVDFKSVLPEQVSIGFSTNTLSGMDIFLNSWYFNSSLEPQQTPPPPPPPPPSSPPQSPPGLGSGVIVGAAAGATMFLVLLFAAAAALVVRRRRHQNMMETEEYYTDSEGEGEPMSEIEMGTGPRRFPYRELMEATKNFAAEEKLGQGGFGAVYQGYLRDPAGLAVAIKRLQSSIQGKKEYKSEVKVISRLRHRNLVQLIGWCHGHDQELLLVYELMPNRSLDIHLHSKQGTFLTWPMRMKILLELGSALLYLHEEWEQCVLHRDIKPSNVMLDESFGAKLGDFGLARLVDHAAGMQTMTAISGTPGYLDPECVNTGRASAESDVYSFGVVLLEVACGRRPMSVIAPNQHQQKNGGVFRLVEWAWGLYGRGAILEAIDERLNGDYDAAEVERVMVIGLWCAHPNPSARPSIRTAMATLQPKVDQAYQLPMLPSKMPVPVFEPFALANAVGMSSSSSHTFGVSSSTWSSMPPHTSGTASSDASTSTNSSKTSSSLLKH
ncbi:L-type lectin-domain containing receptor kinase IX.1-like [Hordeum vulgare subsp. vulgare]|uniref:Protein kinase domain-containing protein n=3 Tax=Hordeum vulgare TaxID=4513 RepID=A0A8I6XIP4_HORVV|nr:L-type lectin-domain containing receptor kinase IX.1-like [Hordeum vulgare subsp. vulgare]